MSSSLGKYRCLSRCSGRLRKRDTRRGVQLPLSPRFPIGCARSFHRRDGEKRGGSHGQFH